MVMTRKQKKTLIRIIVAAVLLIAVALLPDIPMQKHIPLLTEGVEGVPNYGWVLLKWPFYLIPYLVIGWDILWKAIRNIGHGQVLDRKSTRLNSSH